MSARDMFEKLPDDRILPIAVLPSCNKRQYYNFFDGSKYLNTLKHIGPPKLYHNLDNNTDRYDYKQEHEKLGLSYFQNCVLNFIEKYMVDERQREQDRYKMMNDIEETKKSIRRIEIRIELIEQKNVSTARNVSMREAADELKII